MGELASPAKYSHHQLKADAVPTQVYEQTNSSSGIECSYVDTPALSSRSVVCVCVRSVMRYFKTQISKTMPSLTTELFVRQISLISLGTEHTQTTSRGLSHSHAHYGGPLTVTCPMQSLASSWRCKERCGVFLHSKYENTFPELSPHTVLSSLIENEVMFPHGDPDGIIFPWRSRDSSVNITALWGRCITGQKAESIFATTPAN